MIVLYGITLVPLAKNLKDVDPIILSHFYTNDMSFNGSVMHSEAQFKLLMYQGPDQGYPPEPAESLFIADNPEEEETERQGFECAGLRLNYVGGNQYLGAYFGAQGGARGMVVSQSGGMSPQGI